MTPDIERLAKEAGLTRYNVLRGSTAGDSVKSQEFGGTLVQLAKFAALVAEECAKVCDSLAEEGKPSQQFALDLASDAIRGKFAQSNDKPEAQ